jgi:hypothetical protein
LKARRGSHQFHSPTSSLLFSTLPTPSKALSSFRLDITFLAVVVLSLHRFLVADFARLFSDERHTRARTEIYYCVPSGTIFWGTHIKKTTKRGGEKSQKEEKKYQSLNKRTAREGKK